jgi:hypothetical protein
MEILMPNYRIDVQFTRPATPTLQEYVGLAVQPADVELATLVTRRLRLDPRVTTCRLWSFSETGVFEEIVVT